MARLGVAELNRGKLRLSLQGTMLVAIINGHYNTELLLRCRKYLAQVLAKQVQGEPDQSPAG